MLPTTGRLSLTAIAGEVNADLSQRFGLGDLYAGGAHVYIDNGQDIPATGELRMSDFYGYQHGSYLMMTAGDLGGGVPGYDVDPILIGSLSPDTVQAITVKRIEGGGGNCLVYLDGEQDQDLFTKLEVWEAGELTGEFRTASAWNYDYSIGDDETVWHWINAQANLFVIDGLYQLRFIK